MLWEMTLSRFPRSCLAAGLCLALFPAVAAAQDSRDYKKDYEDALAQLKQAQDRKSELNRENEQLKAQLAALEAEAKVLRRDAADHAERTFFLRSHYAAWKRFIAANPELKKRWDQYLGAAAAELPAPLVDPLVPLEPAESEKPGPSEEERVEEPATDEPATTRPAPEPGPTEPEPTPDARPTDPPAEPVSTPATAPSTSPASE